MTETATPTPLGIQILEHWKRHRPRMVEDLERANRLRQAILAAQELTSNLLYELTVVQKMEYHRAWEIATREWAFSPSRGGSAPTGVRSGDPRSTPTAARDFRISPANGIGEGSLKQKAQANLAAVRTLKIIEAENRAATPEEKAVLVKYSGWGAIPNAFAAQPPEEWRTVAHELKDLLTAQEYASARASTPNAHYTSPDVIQAIWQAMERFGLQRGGHILEPSIGVGHFFGLMPENLHPARRTGVELDSITARIAARLYLESTIHQRAFEETPFPKDYFDAAIGNIPFGNYPVYDPAYRGSPHLTHAIHDYFLAKSLDVVRPGGLIALITSRYTMDKQDSAVRRHLADGTILLGAIRLPNTTFKANAGTEVTTDILFLQKRAPESALGEKWTELHEIETPEGPVFINEYFARHSEMMLGRMGIDSRLFENAAALIGNIQPGDLEEAVSHLPANVYKGREIVGPLMCPDADQVPAAGTVKEGGLADRDGEIVVCRGGVLQPLAVAASVAARISGMLRVRDAVRDVFRTQLVDAPDETIAEARRHLNRTYDSFVARFGPLSTRENVRAFAGDPDQPLLLSLEEFDPETRRATKTAVFERRTLERYRPVERAETASEALLVSLNEKGKINWPRMESLTGRSAAELKEELGPLAYSNPETGEWETTDQYLSGNVRAKLAAAQDAARNDSAYHRNVEALQSVQPKDLEPGEIEGRLGSSWISASDIREFVADLLDVPRSSVRIGHAPAIATWTVELDYTAKYVVNNTTTHGTARFRASELIEQALNGRTPTAYDEHEDGTKTINQPETIAAREKQQQSKDRFCDWVWEDRERAERLAKDYNFRFNNLRLRDFDGSHLTLPGMVRTSLRDGVTFNRAGPAGEAATAGPDLDLGSGQRVSREGILARMEHAVRSPGRGLSQSPSPLERAFGTGRHLMSRRAARHRQRLYIFLRGPALSRVARAHAQSGMRRQSLRLELRLDGELKARYQDGYLEIAECGERTVAAEPAGSKPVRKDHNRGGKSSWMDGFFDRPCPPLWKAIGG